MGTFARDSSKKPSWEPHLPLWGDLGWRGSPGPHVEPLNG